MDRFSTEEKCKNYLLEMKWKDGFSCDKCSHNHYWKKKEHPYMRVCKNCRHINSVTANTLFHKVKFESGKAFPIMFEMATTTKSCSSTVMARKPGINQKTAWLFMSKVRKAMSSSGSYPFGGSCEVDEILIGRKVSGKRGRGAKVDTDSWRSYTPFKGVWNIEQSKSDPKKNFQSIHRFIQQLKGWIRGIFHRIGDRHLQGYLNEFCFRMNRHLFRDTIFHTLMVRMMEHLPVTRAKLVL